MTEPTEEREGPADPAIFDRPDVQAKIARALKATASTGPNPYTRTQQRGGVMRTFTLYRRNREAVAMAHESEAYSVPGDEPTCEGVVFTDGTVAVRWRTAFRSTVV